MILSGVVRIGRDVELRYTSSGTAVAGISGVYEYGRKGDDGKKLSQWVELALFGKQAESLAPYLTKGTVINVTADDVHIETYQGKNGQGSKLTGKVAVIGFVPKQSDGQAKPAPEQSSGSAGHSDFDDSIPFAQFERGFLA